MAKQKVTYRAGEGDPRTVEWRGRKFTSGVAVDLDDGKPDQAALIEAAKTNPAFDVGDENKAAERQAENDAAVKAEATAELAAIDDAAAALEQRHTEEANAMEARHQQERDAFMNANQKKADALRAIVRGSDGTDDHEVVDQKPVDDSGDPNAPKSQPPVQGSTGTQTPNPTPAPSAPPAPPG